MDLKAFPLGSLQTNCYVLSNNGKALVVDPGGDPSPVLEYLKSSGLTLDRILVTHLHFDHTGGCSALSDATGAKIYASSDDDVLMDSELGRGGFMGTPVNDPFEYENISEGEENFIGLECKILATPGHSPGSLTFYFPEAELAFVGDLVFKRSVGRTDFPGGDSEQLMNSVIQKIFPLPGNTALLSGHGAMTTNDEEKTHNPFFSGVEI